MLFRSVQGPAGSRPLVPTVPLANAGPVHVKIPITEISKFSSSFGAEEDARAYETRILEEIKEKMNALRERKDSFTATEEISL